MDATIGQRSIYRATPSRRDRAVSIVGAIAATAIVILLLLELGVIPPLSRKGEDGLVLIPLERGSSPDTTRARHAPAKAVKAASKAERAEPQLKAVPTPPAPHVIPPPIVPPLPAWNVMPLSSQELASVDSAMASHHAAAGPPAPAGDQGNGQDDSGGASAGSGPGGERLYNADWYRKPRDIELATYMPAHPPRTGFGMIACRTVPDYRVEDCQELDETPGSGFARTLREAAWQFRVLPPRINGRALVGSWVRIRFDFTDRPVG